MSYALVVSNSIQTEGGLPLSARRQDTQQWVMGLRDASVTLQRACGWYLVVEVARPADTPTHTYDRTLTLPAGIPTVTWVQRLKVQAEIDAATADTNNTTLRQQAETAITNNIDYLAIVGPTNAQVVAQVRALTRHVDGIIRLVIGKLDSTNGT